MAPSPKATLQTWTKLRQWNNLWFLSVRSCSRYQFECRTSGECIAIYNACDGIPQCADGSDEAAELGCPATSKRQSQSFCWFAFTVFWLDRFFLLGAATETTTTTKWPVTTHAPVVSKSVIFPDMKTNVNDWRPSRDRYAPRDFDSDANNGRWKTSEGSRTYAGFPHTRSNSISQFPAAKPRCIVFPN